MTPMKSLLCLWALQLVEYRNAGEISAAAAKDAWDITFMPHEAEREKLMDHGPAYVSYDSTYIVRAGLDIHGAACAGQSGLCQRCGSSMRELRIALARYRAVVTRRSWRT